MIEEIAGLVGAPLTAGINIYNANQSRKSQERAAEKIAQSNREAIAQKQKFYDEAKNNFNPYIQAGGRGLSTYESLLGSNTNPEFDFQRSEFQFDKYKDPAAEYAMQEARRALEASAFSKGALGGGNLRALNTDIQNRSVNAYKDAYDRFTNSEKFGADLAANKYTRDYGFQKDQLGGYFDLGKLGQSSVGQLAGIGQDTTNTIANLTQGIGSAQGAGMIGASQAYGSGLSNAAEGLFKGLGSYFQGQRDNKEQEARTNYWSKV